VAIVGIAPGLGVIAGQAAHYGDEYIDAVVIWQRYSLKYVLGSKVFCRGSMRRQSHEIVVIACLRGSALGRRAAAHSSHAFAFLQPSDFMQKQR
jgi:hypothetical protein